jgi:hypothetical protein
MGKWRLIGSGTRRPIILIEDKVKAIADIYRCGQDPAAVLKAIYEKVERKLPKNPTLVVANWRKYVQDRLDEDDPAMIDLCKQHGVIEEGEPRGRRKK